MLNDVKALNIIVRIIGVFFPTSCSAQSLHLKLFLLSNQLEICFRFAIDLNRDLVAVFSSVLPVKKKTAECYAATRTRCKGY